MTEVFVLRPINGEDPTWERSSHSATYQVYAESESHAEGLAVINKPRQPRRPEGTGSGQRLGSPLPTTSIAARRRGGVIEYR